MKNIFIKINNENIKKITSIFLVVSIFISPFSSLLFYKKAEAVFNKEINYQGKLTTSASVAVPNGSYNMEFKLYTISTGGSAIWTETRINSNRVAVANGLFSVMLGEIQSLAGVDFNQTLYLGVNIGGTAVGPVWDGEMTPRKKLGAVPAAIEAEKAGKTNNLIGGNATTLLGSIPYQSGADTTSLVVPNTTTTRKFFRMTGDGTNGAIPIWDTLTAADVGLTNPVTGTGTLNKIAKFTSTGSAVGDSQIFDNGTNVGIGTVSPASLLQLHTLAGANPTFSMSDADVTHGMTTLLPTDQLFKIQSLAGAAGGTWLIGASDISSISGLDLHGVIGSNDPTDSIPAVLITGSKKDTGTGTTTMGALETVFQVETGAATAGTKLMTILGSGNVGIGTTAPAMKLSVQATTSAQAFEIIGATGGYTNIDLTGDRTSGNLGGLRFKRSGDTQAFFEMNPQADRSATYFSTGDGATTLTPKITLLQGGNIGIGTISPTAKLQIAAGTATAGTAPLKLTSGTNLTTPEAGAIEWDGTNLFVTQTTGPTRKTIAYTTDIHSPVTLGAIGSTSNANGMTLTGQLLNLEPASATYGGVVTTGTQTFAGAKTFNTLLSATAGATISGAAINLNASSNFAVNIGTGTSTGAVTIGGGSNTFAINSTAFDVSTAGAVSGVTTISASTSVSSPIFQGISAATTFGNALYATTIAGNALTISPTAWTTIPTISGLITATSGITSNGTATFNGVTNIGDGGDAVAVNSNTWDISSAGAVSGVTTLTTSGKITQGGYLNLTGDNLLHNADFETGNSDGWSGVTSVVAGGYAGNYAAQITGSSSLDSSDYIPVDPTRDVLQLEAYVKKTVAGTTPGVLYFGYYAYNASKVVITTSPCGSYCYFAASSYVVPVDSTWHKVSATTTGEGTAYPNFPVGTKYIKVLGLVNYGGSGDTVTQIDHISLKKINNGPLFAGNNFSSSNLTDQYQQSKIYTTSGNILTFEPSSGGTVNINSASSNPVSITTSNNNNLALMPNGTGNVGVGLTNPTYKLDINTPSGVTNFLQITGNGVTSSNGFFRIGNYTSSNGIMSPVFWSKSSNTYPGVSFIGDTVSDTGSTAIIEFIARQNNSTVVTRPLFSFQNYTTTGTVMQILANGNVGIGTVSPQIKLDVSGSSALSTTIAGVQISDTSGNASSRNWGIYNGFAAYGSLDFRIGGSAGATSNAGGAIKLTILKEGNVGIGTAAPTSLLSLGGTAAQTIQMERNTTAATAGQGLTLSSGGAIAGTADLAGGDLTLKSGISTGTGTSALRFFTATAGSTGAVDNAPTEKMTILGSGNVGINNTSPGYKLDVSGYIKSTIGYLAPAGSVSTPSYIFSTDVNSGMYSISDNVLGFSTNGTNVLTLNAGNVGIGTTAPTATLHLKAGTATANTAPLKLTSGTNLTAVEAGAMEFDGTDLFFTPSTTRETIAFMSDITTGLGSYLPLAGGTMTGNILMTSNKIIGGSTTTADLNFQTTTGVGATGADMHFLVGNNGATEAMTILNNGNVGIGTTDTLKILDIRKASSEPYDAIYGGESSANYGYSSDNEVGLGVYNTDMTDNNYAIIALKAKNSHSTIVTTHSDLVFSSAASGDGSVERMRINGISGNVGIGTTTPEAKLEVQGDSQALRTRGTATGANWAGRIIAGGSNVAFLMGEYNTMAWLGAHNAALSAWSDFYINPDGGSKLYLGGTGDVNPSTLNPIVTVDNTTGSVGIGTTAPGAKLSILNSASDIIFKLEDNRTAVTGDFLSKQSFYSYGGNESAYIGLRHNEYLGNVPRALVFGVNSSERMRINYSGNVGIGTTNPLSTLHLYKNGGVTLRMNGTTNNDPLYESAILTRYATGYTYMDLGYYNNSSTFSPTMTISANGGNVGIGTTSPTSKLHVSGTIPIYSAAPFTLDASLTAVNPSGVGITPSLTQTLNPGTVSGMTVSPTVVVNATANIVSAIRSYGYSLTNNGTTGIATGIYLDQPSISGTAPTWQGALYVNSGQSYFSGSVGIGTTNPQSNLHVYGGASGITPYANSTLTIEDDTSAYISIITPNANERGLFFGEAASNIAGGIIYNNASTPDGFQFRVNGNSTKMIIDSNGNIGIGTTAPTSILHTIASGAKTAAYTGNLLTNTATSSTASIAKIGLDIQSTGTWNGASAVNTGLNVNVSGGTTNYAATFMGGNVGIGTTAPTTNLHITGSGSTSLKVESTGSTSYPGLSILNDGNKSANLGIAGSGSALTGPLAPNTGYVSSNGAGGLAFYSVDASAPIAFYLAGASSANEKLRITSTGNVGIGTTTPTGGKLEITGDGSGVNSTIRANNTNNANSATMGVYSNSVGGFFRAYGSTFSVSSLASKAAFGPDGANGIVVFSNAGSASGGTGSISLRGGGYDTAAEKLYIDKDGSYFTGNVGIGITIPLGKLHTSESSSLNLPLFERSGQTTDTLLMGAKILATKTTDMADGFGSAIGFAIKDDFGSISMVGLIGAERRGADSTGDIIFKPYLSGTSNERMRITSAGNVGIGTTAPSSKFEIGSSDLGNGVAGPVITLGRNTNATATGAGSINFMKKDGTAGYVWQDNAGNMRINTSAPTNALDTSGTVIGAQTSTRDTKQNIDDYSSYDEALSMIVNAPLHTFRYKNEVSGYGEDSPLAKTRIGFIADEVDDMFMVGNVIDQVSINGLLMASIKAMNLKTKDLTSLDTSIATSLGSLIKSFLGDINNGVEYLYASVIQSEKVETNMLCVGSVCVTEDQFMEIVTKNVTTGSTSSVSGTDQTGQTGGEINPTPVDGDGSNTGTTTDTTTEENPPADTNGEENPPAEVATDTPTDTSSDTTTSAPLEVIEVTTDAPTEGGGTTPTE